MLAVVVALAPDILDQHRCSLVDPVDDSRMFNAVKPESHHHARLDAELHDRALFGGNESVRVFGVTEESAGDQLESQPIRIAVETLISKHFLPVRRSV